jgi:tRNA A-37 threonylcarbamoyl transferase component Bud32
MDKIIKELSGHSGCKIFLRENETGLYVEKTGNIERNFNQMKFLYDACYPVPEIYSVGENVLIMEYIHGLDMKNYLIHNNSHQLFNFLSVLLDNFSDDSKMKDYTETYYSKLRWLDDCDEMPFTKEEFIGKLPKMLPQSTYHGDLTLENIMYTDPGFHLIDPVTIEYDSYIFDIAKLRQDLECKWFLRNTNVKLEVKLQNLQNKLRRQYEDAFDDNLLILMLLRVYLHTKQGDDNHKFIMKEINRLWK